MKSCKKCHTKLDARNKNGLCRKDYFADYNRRRPRPEGKTIMGSKEYRAKQSEAQKGRKATPEQLFHLKAGREHLRLRQNGAADNFYESTYVPGPRYHYDCGACNRPYITNLAIPSSICPFCHAHGVAVSQMSLAR